ncbi:TPA: hypothetical protein DCZ46_01155 [Candidatus Campbellbacteria bacterium]|nr:MAG: protein of unknown function with transmembrane region [Candidatus Campbellbacteria bacterium GW2011_OD1_34_28]KKP75307.1 MAG: hypothetical protein UR74_C0001G0163 [Candidatus Campbellbacteria bacterium GW2011_GWD2_35_24]KKP76132.1 MAG: hypothetical protein UR75_C0001G0166 [Candidatus Campbellbacteria bacterium GW2011_GWC2_35_28]KKP77321.1 MAG: hypothetical protein UR76_C0001G0166 [Candidatus Campbellbacteria bacterium GW2011_GWC1_35_31]KKP79250.1 MAG: hypothetical protein UR79_C0001G016
MPEEPTNKEEYNDEPRDKVIEISGDSIKELEPEGEKTPTEIVSKPTAEEMLLEKTSQPEEKIVETPKKEALPQSVVFEPEKEEIQDDLKEKEENSLMKTIRTYKSDVVEEMKKQKSSITSMVLAEKDRQQKQGKFVPKIKPNKKIFILFGGTFLVLAIGFAGYLFIKPNTGNENQEITVQQISTLILPNYKREIYVDRVKRDSIITALQKEKAETSIPLGYVIQFFLTTEDKTKSFVIEDEPDYKLLVTTESFFDGIESKIPNSLTRNLGQEFIFGYHSSLGNNPFLILKVKSYNSVFAGMLDWEKTIYRDLSPVFVKDDSKMSLDNNPFQDIVVSNKDVRAILNEMGKIELAYSFPNPETLIITNNETTLQELYRRVTNARLERKD